MSSFWCLTGAMDARPSASESVNDVVNTLSPSATVSLNFTLGGLPCFVSRRRGSGPHLRARLDGSDATMQTATQTQGRIEGAVPGAETLRRCVYLDQHMEGDLLRCTAGELAGAVGGLCGVEVFKGCRKVASERGREVRRRREGGERVRKVREGDLGGLRRKVEEGRRRMEEKAEGGGGGEKEVRGKKEGRPVVRQAHCFNVTHPFSFNTGL
jgi:hypothetical protein